MLKRATVGDRSITKRDCMHCQSPVTVISYHHIHPKRALTRKREPSEVKAV